MRSIRHCALIIGAAIVAMAISIDSASAQSFNTLYDFCSQGKNKCLDGTSPNEVVVQITESAETDLYGTTSSGGKHKSGVVFETKLKFFQGTEDDILYTFCSKKNCADGSQPTGPLVMDQAGNIYGITNGGNGTVYKLSFNGTKWSETVLYSFSGSADGGGPIGGLTYAGASTGAPYDGVSPLYGETIFAGKNGDGGIFSLTPPASPGKGKKWKEQVLYDFCSQNNCSDGFFNDGVDGSMVMDASGNLFGVTDSGGTKNHGVVFELGKNGANWTHTVLYNFCSKGGDACTDGALPMANAIFDTNGNLYGTTDAGGSGNQGVLYKINVGASKPFAKLYDFCSQANCTDGAGPMSTVAFDGHGNIWGTTSAGGGPNSGVLYEWNGSAMTVVQNFCTDDTCSNGASPHAGLFAITAAGAESLWGTTTSGGNKHSAGTEFGYITGN